MGVVGAALYQVPNQPIYFPEDPSGKGRTEDAFIAWTWNHYIFHTNDSDWLARLPMTKAAVRAMDTVTDFFKDKQNISKFVVSGASKRGWTTWTTGLTDTRAVAIIPIVLDALHLITSLHHMWRAYGGWSYVLKDYYQVNLTKHFDDAAFEWLCQIEDPFYYLPDPERFQMPKLVINAAGDEFLQNDNDMYWWDQMPGPKFRQMCQNAEHSEATGIPEILENIAAWGNQYFLDKNWPRFNWTIDSTTGYITVMSDPTNVNKPLNVTMWHAMSFEPELKGLRDWRLESGSGFQPVFWRPDALTETFPGSNTWIAKQNTPTKGWMAFFVEMTYPGPTPFYNASKVTHYHLTTQVSIVPKVHFPFEDCYGVDCYGTLV
jgi:PhoPQ-activated pathogenicity-related protein